MNWVNQHFEDLEYLYMIIIPLVIIPSNVTKRGQQKLPPSELMMDASFGRSTFIHFKSFH